MCLWYKLNQFQITIICWIHKQVKDSIQFNILLRLFYNISIHSLTSLYVIKLNIFLLLGTFESSRGELIMLCVYLFLLAPYLNHISFCFCQVSLPFRTYLWLSRKKTFDYCVVFFPYRKCVSYSKYLGGLKDKISRQSHSNKVSHLRGICLKPKFDEIWKFWVWYTTQLLFYVIWRDLWKVLKMVPS